MTRDPDVIYLEPAPGSPEGRLWCEDPVWDELPDCEGGSVRYIRADQYTELRERLREAVEVAQAFVELCESGAVERGRGDDALDRARALLEEKRDAYRDDVAFGA